MFPERMVFFGQDTPGVARIRQKLSQMRVPTRGDTDGHSKKQRGYGMWAQSTVAGMLRNEVYAGSWHWGKDPETRLTVQVPAIVSRETWEAAQAQRKKNTQSARRSLKHEYLMRRRLHCGKCGLKVYGRSSGNGRRLYYSCTASSRSGDIVKECDAPFFRTDHVDAAVWKWVKKLLTDPEVLERGLRQFQDQRDTENQPLLQRLTTIGGLISERQTQLERLLDLYLSGEFPKEVLTQRRIRLEESIGALEKELASLTVRLQGQTLSEGQIHSLQALATEVAAGIEIADENPEHRRRVIEELDVWGTLVIEDGQKVVYVRCIVDSTAVSVESTLT